MTSFQRTPPTTEYVYYWSAGNEMVVLESPPPSFEEELTLDIVDPGTNKVLGRFSGFYYVGEL